MSSPPTKTTLIDGDPARPTARGIGEEDRLAAARSLVGTVVRGRYTITDVIGAGGMGAVLEAEQSPFGRKVALKIVRPDADHRDAEARFAREAKAVSQLSHPNVVSVYEFGATEDGLQFLAMEHIEGPSLKQRLREGSIEWRRACEIARDIASGLGAAHDAGILHRDLKPDNIMLARVPGRAEHVKILDFGIAKLGAWTKPTGDDDDGETALTATGAIVGTAGYIAPELAKKGEVSVRSDLYALGVLWFEMLTGQKLFTGATPIAIIMKHASEPSRAPSATTPRARIPPQVDDLVLSLLEKDPSARPATASVVVDRITALLDDEAASAGLGLGISEVPPSTVALNSVADAAGVDTIATPLPQGRGRLSVAAVAVLFVLAAAGLAAVFSRGDAQPSATSPPRTDLVAGEAFEGATAVPVDPRRFLDFFVKDEAGVRRGKAGEAVRSGDQLRFVLRLSEQAFVAVLSRDGAGTVSTYASAGDRLVPGAAGDFKLPTATALDDVPGAEAIYGFRCDVDVGVLPLLEAVRTAEPGSKVDPPPGCDVDSIVIHKR